MTARYDPITHERLTSVVLGCKIDLPAALFVASAFFAPLEMLLVGAFTIYDALTVALAVVAVASGRRMRSLPFALTMAAYVFLLFALLSTYRAVYPGESMTQIVQFAFIFFVQLPVVIALAATPKVTRVALGAFAAGALVGMISSLASGDVTSAGRTVVFYSYNPNRLGYPTGYLLPFVLHFAFHNWRAGRILTSTALTLPVLYVLVWALAASGSRSATVATLVGVLLFWMLRRRVELSLRALVYWSFSIVLLGLLALAVSQSEYLPSTLRDRIERTFMGEESLTQDRVDLAIGGWRAFLESPLVGLGLDNFRYRANEYVFVPFGQLPHNLWIQLLSAVGAVGTLAFGALMVGWFRFLNRAHRSNTDLSSRELIAAFIASMSAILTQYLFLPVLIQRQYWLLYGLGLASAICLRVGFRHESRIHPRLDLFGHRVRRLCFGNDATKAPAPAVSDINNTNTNTNPNP